MLRLCSESSRSYLGRPHLRAIACRCYINAKERNCITKWNPWRWEFAIRPFDEIEIAEQRLVRARFVVMQCVIDEESAEAIVAECPS